MAIRNHINETLNIRQVYEPEDKAAATVTSDEYDTCGSSNSRAESGLLLVNLGNISGTPDAMSLVFTLYDKEASGDSYAATSLTLTLDADDHSALHKLEWKPSAYKRYQSWRYVLGFTAGSTPKVLMSVTELRGALAQLPVTASV